MAKFRVGRYQSLVIDYGYVIQKKKWWGWSNWNFYNYAENAIEDGKILQKNGHEVEFYI